MDAQKEHGEKGCCPEYLQCVLATIRQPVFLNRILKKKIGRSEFSSEKVGATEISQNKERNYYNQKNLYNFESILHF